MTAQLLFYENVAAVSSEAHRDLCIEPQSYAFADNVNSVPLTAVEMRLAAAEYPIVFAGNDEAISPVVVLGIQDKQNSYVDDEGKWSAKYVPAFVRRYPFVFSQTDETSFTLCVDENFAGCNRDGKGQRLFDDKGERTEYLNGILKFLEEYQRQFLLTQQFCSHLKELDLLRPVQAKFTSPAGETQTLGGFSSVDHAKLKELPAEEFAKMAKTEELDLIYAHLMSMNNMARVAQNAAAEMAGAS